LPVAATPTLYQIEAQLRAALESPTPRHETHAALAPRPRSGWQAGFIPRGARTAAVLVLLFPARCHVHFVLTRRARTVGQHAGQVSLPGGALDEGESIESAAIREAREEIGLPGNGLRVLGRLSPLYIPVSNFALHPVVAVLDQHPVLVPAATEVARILEVQIRELQDPTSLKHGWRWRNKEKIAVPYFELQGERVWGATAMVLGEFLCLLQGNQTD